VLVSVSCLAEEMLRNSLEMKGTEASDLNLGYGNELLGSLPSLGLPTVMVSKNCGLVSGLHQMAMPCSF
jgi:hypothetical protein